MVAVVAVAVVAVAVVVVDRPEFLRIDVLGKLSRWQQIAKAQVLEKLSKVRSRLKLLSFHAKISHIEDGAQSRYEEKL
ncbi:hypothetical protein V2H45_12330 [Tumidithrix elongata RA019]|uniref:Uncharacterized protein n=2 Tax=Tumidithrix TaxID=3088355 RepID=A0AAW9PWZ1_9CYAN|nr:hypothetical protein [Tumidithrix elongata RA019]